MLARTASNPSVNLLAQTNKFATLAKQGGWGVKIRDNPNVQQARLSDGSSFSSSSKTSTVSTTSMFELSRVLHTSSFISTIVVVAAGKCLK